MDLDEEASSDANPLHPRRPADTQPSHPRRPTYTHPPYPRQPNAVVLVLPAKPNSRSTSPQTGGDAPAGPEPSSGAAGGGFGSLQGQPKADDGDDALQNDDGKSVDAALRPAGTTVPVEAAGGVSSMSALEHQLAVERLNRVRSRVAAFESIAGQSRGVGSPSPRAGASPQAGESPVVHVGRLSVRVAPKSAGQSGGDPQGVRASRNRSAEGGPRGRSLEGPAGPGQDGLEEPLRRRASVGARSSESAAQVRARVAEFETIAQQSRSPVSPALSSGGVTAGLLS